MTLGVRKMKLMGVAAVALLAMSASGCSSLPSVPDWVDPTTWFSGDEPDNGQTPDLASVPDKPEAPSADEQQKVAESLAGDRTNATYSAEALRGGTEPAAAPPANVEPAQPVEEKVAPKAAAAPAPAPVQVAAVDRSVSQDPDGSAAPGTLPATAPGVPAAVAAATPAAEPVKTAELPQPAPVKPAKKVKAKKPVQVAEIAPAAPVTHTAPADVAPVTPVAPAAPVATVSSSDAALGFQPSSAPPLDPSVSQFVAAPIVDHYRATAPSSAAPVGVASAAPAHKAHHPKAATDVAMGGPEQMEGKVVANLDTLGSAPEAKAPVMANPNGAAAVVFFPGDTVALTASGKAQVRSAVAQYKAAGGQGYVRVVGHSSSRTANMPAAKHIEVIFKKSQDRANAVAQELIKAGIPADHVLVEAVGDTDPVYYESMPKGEDGNRRAEIFLQG
jgi:outer membrane protein OmpA-like peptidoglycan-associated protein